MEKVTTRTIKKAKAMGRKITVLTAYDYSSARLYDEAGIDILLVGDSLGMVVLGYDSTIPVTMEDMLHHTRAVSRGAQRAMVVADMPFLSYHLSLEETLRNAGRFLQEAGAIAVKLEGGQEIAPKVEALTKAGIPVMGHLGLTPQSVNQLGGFLVQGKGEEEAQRIIADALALQEAGAFSIVLECIPASLAKTITSRLDIPTIGIGSGPDCDGQVLVSHDLLGLYSDLTPRFVKKYADLRPVILAAVAKFREEVEKGLYPGPEHILAP